MNTITINAEHPAAQTIETTVATIKAGVAKATASFETAQAKAKEAAEKALKAAENVVSFNQGNVEAVVKAGQIWATGMQDLSKTATANARVSFDQGVAVFKALTSVKSLKDAFEMQAGYARSSIEKAVAESKTLTDASMKLAEQTLAPLTARVSAAVETFGKAA